MKPPFDERSDDSKVTRAVVVKQYQGDIKGTSTTEWLMAYAQGRHTLRSSDSARRGADRRKERRVWSIRAASR